MQPRTHRHRYIRPHTLSLPPSLPLSVLPALDKLSTHIIYTFERATLRHVEFATHLRLAFYEFISVHLRLMWRRRRVKPRLRRQLVEPVIKLNCLTANGGASARFIIQGARPCLCAGPQASAITFGPHHKNVLPLDRAGQRSEHCFGRSPAQSGLSMHTTLATDTLARMQKRLAEFRISTLTTLLGYVACTYTKGVGVEWRDAKLIFNMPSSLIKRNIWGTERAMQQNKHRFH